MLTNDQIKAQVEQALQARSPRNVLMVVPDFTRFFSNAGLIASIAYHWCMKNGAKVQILEALGTHVPMTEAQVKEMYGDIPFSVFHAHDWRKDVVKIGKVPGDYVKTITEGLWKDGVDVEVNRMVMDPAFDLVLSIGQVVPHEVIGMANHSKNLFVGVGGSDMINQSHMIGAVYGMERMMGRDYTPVRKVFDYAAEHFLKTVHVLYMLTVCTAPNSEIQTHGLFIGEGRKCLEDAIKLAQEKNIDFVEHGLKKCIVYLDPKEFKSTWLGNKSVYRTRMAMADGGKLIVLAPGIDKFGEDNENDKLIRRYGYRGRLHTLDLLNSKEDLKANMSVAAHLIHGSSDDRFSITYAVKSQMREQIASVGFIDADYDEISRKYDPAKLKYGYNTVDGEEVFFIPNPALGLWINREKFNQ
ncbi:MAG: lactate racemase domain-containing protein [Sphaerochaetaceae bacterium]|jgi:nickel-dependent lactate racemase|nr:lactate racemase domain-containing protein [Sphaerochaetaceae bacterium]